MDIHNSFMLERRRQLMDEWPLAWRDMTAQWTGGRADALWVMYSANYLLRTGGVRWMIDPFRLKRRRPDVAETPMEALSSGSFVVMTHNHGDHVDVELLSYLATLENF